MKCIRFMLRIFLVASFLFQFFHVDCIDAFVVDTSEILEQLPDAKDVRIEVKEYSKDGIPWIDIEGLVLFDTPSWRKTIDGMKISDNGQGEAVVCIEQSAQQQKDQSELSSDSFSNDNSLPARDNAKQGSSSISVTVAPSVVRRIDPGVIDISSFNMGRIKNKRAFEQLSVDGFFDVLTNRWYRYGHLLGISFKNFSFTQYNLYQFENFMILIRSDTEWGRFVDSLHEKLENDTDFDIATNSIQGFQGRKHARAISNIGKVTGFIHKALEIKPGISEFHKKINIEKKVVDIWRRASKREREEEQAEEEEKQRKLENEKKIKATLKEELQAKRAVQAGWRDEELMRRSEQQKNDVELAESLEKNVDDSTRAVLPLSVHQELQFLEGEFEQLKKECTGQRDLEICTELGLESIENALAALEDGRSCDYEKHKSRAQALHDTFVNACAMSNQQYNLSVRSQSYLRMLDIDPDNYMNLSGIAIQHQLNSELVSTINQASGLMHAYLDNLHINNIVTLAYRTADQARMCNQEVQLREGFALSDFCSNVLEMGKCYAFIVAEGFDVCLSAAQEGCSIFTTGIGQGIETSGRNMKDFLDKATSDPVRAVSDFVDSTHDTSLALGRLFCFMLESPGKKGSEDIRDSILAFDDKIKAMSNHDRAVGAVAFGTEMLLSIGAWEFAGAKLAPIARVIKEFSTISRAELAVATHACASSPTALKLTAPITEMFGDGLLFAKMAVEEGKDSVRKAIDIVKRNPSTLKVEKNAVEAVKEVARIEKEISSSPLNELIKKSKPFGKSGHQRMTLLEGGEQLRFRRDVGEFAHAIAPKYPTPVDHYNIEVWKPYIKKNGKDGHRLFYNMHVIVDESGGYLDHLGRYVGRYAKYNKRKI